MNTNNILWQGLGLSLIITVTLFKLTPWLAKLIGMVCRNIADRMNIESPERFKEQLSKEQLSLVAIAGCDDPERVLDIIFVHGISGDSINTWKSEKQSDKNYWHYWLAADLPKVGVWSLDYAAHRFKWEGHSMPLVDRAPNVLALLDVMKVADSNRPLVFVAHSLGGLLVKQMLHNARDSGNPRFKRIAKQTKGIFFLSTPHNGADVATWGMFFDRFFPLVKGSVALADLTKNNSALRDLTRWYQNNYSNLGLKSEVAWETKKTFGVIVVGEDSANPGIQSIVVTPVDEDHNTIAQPQSRESIVYMRVKDFIQTLIPVVKEGARR